MKKAGKILRRLYWAVTMLFLALSVSVATYAWFTSNHTVDTNTATARSGTESVTLEISEQGGNAFAPVEEAVIQQVNQTNTESLLPVSTSDLQNFVFNAHTVNGTAKSFQRVENERYYYHGRLYLRANAQGLPEGTRLALYLDSSREAGGDMVSTDSGELLDAARLGLVFDNAAQNSTIFRLRDAYNSSGNTSNTMLNGVTLQDQSVLSWNGSGVTPVADPSITLGQRTIQMEGTRVTLAEQPLLTMNLNQIYQLDIYFYIEGCDPDCAENVYYDAANLHLGFYGIVE